MAGVPGAGCARHEVKGKPDALLAAGWRAYRLGEFKEAVRDFEAAASTAAGSETKLQALYGLGTTWNLRRPGNDPKLARHYYEQVVEQGPRDDFAAWSLLALARMKHLVPVGREPDYAAVRAAYREVMERFPGHLAADEAFLYLESTYVAKMTEPAARAALKDLEAFVRDHPQSGFVSACYSLMAVCYESLGAAEPRLRAELKAYETAEVDPTNPFQDNAWRYWNIATIAEFEAGDFDVARTFYRKLIEEYPTEPRKYAAKQALKRMDALEARLRAEMKGGGS